MAQSKDKEKLKDEQVLDNQKKDAKQKSSQSKTSKSGGKSKASSKPDKSGVKEKGNQGKKSAAEKSTVAKKEAPLSASASEKEAAVKVENGISSSQTSYYDQAAKSAYASEEYTNVGNIMADRAIGVKEDFYASELSPTAMGMGAPANGTYPATPFGAVARESERGGAGSIVVLLLLATLLVLFIIGIVGAGGNLTPSGNITGSNSIRYGEATTLNYAAGEGEEFKEGDEIVWIVDGKEVQRLSYQDKNAYSYTLKDAKVGARKVKVVAGNRLYSETDIAVGKPLVTVTVKDAEYTYGDKAPQAAYSVKGLIDGDKEDILSIKSGYSDKLSVRKNAGEYPTKVYAASSDNKYDVEVKQGTVIVKPKEVRILNKITKEYDGTNVLTCDDLKLSGIVTNDDVRAKCDCLYFEDKNAGDKKISTYNIELVGENAKNYVLCNELSGAITPKTVTAEEMAVKNKAYDGKNSVEFQSAGRLNGVVKGDIVAIGDIEASYEDSQAGEDKNVNISKINLVGRDKSNYRFITYPKIKGNIYKNGTDVIPSN